MFECRRKMMRIGASYTLFFLSIFEYLTLFHLLCCCSAFTDVIEPRTAVSKQTKRRSVKITDASDFLGLVKNSDVFIDKTMLLKEIMDHREKVHLITRPHKWAKSVNMDMMRLFFGMHQDKRGNPMTGNRTKRYILFKYGEYTLHFGKGRLQEPLLISKHEKFIEEHQGRHPMIHVTMELTKGKTFNKFLNGIRAMISGTFKSHGYLKDKFVEYAQNASLSKSQRKKFKQYSIKFQKISSKDHMSLDKLESSFALLSKMLNDHFGRPVMILMNDYDQPLHFVINSTVPTAEKTKFIHFYKNFLHYTFKLNSHLKKGILFGTLRLFKEQIFYEYKIDDPQTCVDDRFYEYFGFTELEAGWLFDYRNVSQSTRAKVRDLYLGYQPTNNPDLMIYNVHSLTSFLDEKKYKSYWTDDRQLQKYLSQFLKAASFEEIFRDLTFGNELSVARADLRFNATDFVNLYNFMNDHNREPANFPALALSFLFSLGYLTTNYTRDETVFLRFPNKQIAQEIRIIVSRSYRLKLGVAEPKKAKPLIDQFRMFVICQQNNTNELALSLTKFLAPRSERRVDQALLRQTIDYLAIYIDTYDKFSVKSDDLPDLVLLSADEAIIFKCTTEANSAKVALEEAKIYERLLENISNIRIVKYVGVNLNPNRQVQIKVEEQPHRCYVPER